MKENELLTAVDARTLATKLNADGSCAECEQWCPQGLLCNCQCFKKRTGENI